MRVLDDIMRIAICDDDPEDRRLIAEMTRQAAGQEGIPCEVVCYDSGKALLQALSEDGKDFHTLLLDAVMPEMDGFQLGAAIRQSQNNCSIVYISSNRELAMCGYEVAASRFLAKPVQMDKLQEALRFCYHAGQARQELILPTARGMRKLSMESIMYIETWGRGVRIVLKDGQEEVGMKISELEAMLPDAQFVLCHRSLLVNLAYVQYLRYCELELKTGDVLPVSKYRQNATRDKLMRYLAG